MKFRLIVVTLAAMAVGAAGGCSSKGPKLVKVSGTVKFKDGSLLPVPEKGKGKFPVINFAPLADPAPQPKKGAGGTIDENGHFELFTFKPGDGVIPNKYATTVTMYKDTASPPEKFTGPEFTIDAPRSDLEVPLDKEKK